MKTKLSVVVARAKTIAAANGRNYPAAVREAWRLVGYPQPKNLIRETYDLDNNIGADPKVSLEVAILSCLGHEGALVANHRRGQLELALV